MIIERLKFYADTPTGEKNKYCCWDISSIMDLEDRLIYFMQKGWNIRAAWYEKIDTDTGEVKENSKIDCLQEIFDKAIDLLTKNKRNHSKQP